MSDDTMKVTITLRRHVAERLRAMCHKRGETASELVDRWVLRHDDTGECKAPPPQRDPLADLFGGPFGGPFRR